MFSNTRKLDVKTRQAKGKRKQTFDYIKRQIPPNEKSRLWCRLCPEEGTDEKSALTITVSNSRPLALWTVPTMKSGRKKQENQFWHLKKKKKTFQCDGEAAQMLVKPVWWQAQRIRGGKNMNAGCQLSEQANICSVVNPITNKVVISLFFVSISKETPELFYRSGQKFIETISMFKCTDKWS